MSKAKLVKPDEWSSFSDEHKSVIVSEIAQTWREKGFPHYKLSIDERTKDFCKISKFNRSNMIENKVIKQTLHALGLTWHYFPHHWSIKVGNMKTVFDVWDSDELFDKAIRSRLKWGGFNYDENDQPTLTEANMRKALRTYSGVQRVSNFRPSAAAAIYDSYAKDVVWDMSCGFGGRLLGAIISPEVKHYIGTEPATQTMDGLIELSNDFSHITNTEVTLNKLGSEDYVPDKDSIDLCFTSPPYFDTEKYSDEATQSSIRFNTPDDWNQKFLRPTFANCYFGLKPKAKMILNVADVKTHKTLVDTSIKIATEEGFTHIDTLQYSLSSISKGGFKYEPVLVFQKNN